MAKSMASVWPAACLVVLLSLIVCATAETSDLNGNGVSSKQNALLEEWTDFKRKWQAESSIKSLRQKSKKSSSKSLKHIKKHIETLEKAKKHGLSLIYLGMPSLWSSLLTLREESLACKTDIIDKIVYYTVNCPASRWEYKYALDCFRVYLNTCGHEARYRKLIATINPSKSARYRTLNSYLQGELFSRSLPRDDVHQRKAKLDTLLAALNELSQMASITSEAVIKYKWFVDSLFEVEWTEAQWEKAAQSSIKELSDIRSSQLPLEQIRAHIEMLKKAGKHDVLLVSGLGMPSDWSFYLTLRDKSLGCGPYFSGTIKYHLVDGHADGWKRKHVLDCFCQYLNECGHEKLFKKSMSSEQVVIEDGDSLSHKCRVFVETVEQKPEVASKILSKLKK